ncbi:hypothetical protein DUNSADRAFT_3840 [Dunaliella salina]|uniref:Encoded protein n=1 Tax=Dunaliella salina TaxID=3046 RepID=A0ABQ7GT86_DUNSA|nr:hypothetical protein DUNSADRAFT_3840 [Dunaliella salina]|eukprot:KAF5837824.1 hypothetical protein DUNSADRAFT_3840 [Dunaliella salina]
MHACMHAHAGGDSAGGLGEDGNMSEGGSSGGNGHEPEQRGKRPREEAEDEEEEEGDGEEEVEAQKPGPRVKQHRAGGGGDFVRLEAEMKRAMRMIRSQAASMPMPPQDPIHPGSTPLEATTGSCGARFLAYNMEVAGMVHVHLEPLPAARPKTRTTPDGIFALWQLVRSHMRLMRG